MGRRSLRQAFADRRAARAARRAGPPTPLADPGGDRWISYWLVRRRRADAVAERRLAEALRTWATDRDPAAHHQHPLDPPARPADRPHRWFGEDRDPGRDER